MTNTDILQNNLKAGEGYYITGSESIAYLSGFCGEGSLLITDAEKLLITDFRYIIDAKMSSREYKVCDIKDGLKNIFPDNITKLYVEAEHITYDAYLRLKEKFPDTVIEDDNHRADNLRRIKTEDEILKIKTASGIATRCFTEVLNFIKPGVTEKQIATEFEYLIKKNGASETSFDTIVASGVNSSMPHAIPTDKPIETGDFVTMDFGCKYMGYCSDMTRTFAVKSASERQREIYDIVYKAQHAGLDALKQGAVCSAVDRAARDIIDIAGYKENFGHSLGHSVGLYIHEEPRLSPKCDDILDNNMVITVEPGIYIEGEFGVRIEDLAVVCGEKPRILTNFQKELLII